jgi:hypothetical protein
MQSFWDRTGESAVEVLKKAEEEDRVRTLNREQAILARRSGVKRRETARTNIIGENILATGDHGLLRIQRMEVPVGAFEEPVQTPLGN